MACCGAVFSKFEYVKALIDNNGPSKHYFGSDYYVNCICGNILNRYTLLKYFSHEEIDERFYFVKKVHRDYLMDIKKKQLRTTCLICKKQMNNIDPKEYRCSCFARAHMKCALQGRRILRCPLCNECLVVKEARRSPITPCCGTELDDKSIYIQSLIDLNHKKSTGKTAEKIYCPFCPEASSISNMKEILTQKEIQAIISPPPIKCDKCGDTINCQGGHLKIGCEHRYHPLCIKSILNSEEKKCPVKNCNYVIPNPEYKLIQAQDLIEKCCTNCACMGLRFAILNCSHYVCHKCGENYRHGKDMCFMHDESFTYVTCKICNEDSKVKNLIFKCKHEGDIRLIRSMDITLHSYPCCPRCKLELDDVDLFVLLGEETAAVLLQMRKDLLIKKEQEKQVKEVKKPKEVTYIKTKPYLTAQGFGKKTPNKIYKTKDPFIIATIGKTIEKPNISSSEIKKCTKCMIKKNGYYRYLCHHIFICCECIKREVIPKIEKEGISQYCKECKLPSNIEFMEYAATLGNSNVKKRIIAWKKKASERYESECME